VLAVAGFACFLVFKFILPPIRVIGISMLPTYPDRSRNLVNRFAYLRHGPRRGDVVAIRLTVPADVQLAVPKVMYLKRIIGLPGETVAFVDGRVLINGEILDEPYEKLSCDWNYPPVTLAADEYFLVGDNRSMPQADHTFGRCKRSQIVGKILGQ
jgi:signal peptidase I